MTDANYEFINKNIHRASILELYKITLRPIAYLDDKHAGATHFFLKRTVPCAHLVPVNNCLESIKNIKSETGVHGIHDNIDNFVMTQKRDKFSVIWLDYTCTTYDIDVIKHALQTAPFVCITLSTRGKERDSFMNDIVKMKTFSHILEQPYPYRGKSGVTNMVRCTLMRKNYDSKSTYTRFKIGAKVCANKMTGVIEADHGNTVTIRFDNGMTDTRPRKLVKLNNKIIPWESIKNKYIRMPISLWETPCAYYKTNRRINHGFIFKITKKHYNNVAVQSVLKNGTIHPQPEHWILTREQAQYHVLKNYE